MKKATGIKVGQVVQFPHHQFDGFRSGWNGWIFRAAIIEKIYKNKNGEKCATIRYCTRTAGRYQLLPNVEDTVNMKAKYLFEYNLALHVERAKEFLEYEKNGEQVCWDEDTALLVNHGFVD